MLLVNEYGKRLKGYLLDTDMAKLNTAYISLANAIVDFILNKVPVESTHMLKSVVDANKNTLCNAVIELTFVDSEKLLANIDNVINYRLSLIFVTKLETDMYTEDDCVFNSLGLNKYFPSNELKDIVKNTDLYNKVRFAALQFFKGATSISSSK